MMSCVLRNSGLSSIKFLCATLSHMSICAWVVVAIPLQQVDAAPYAETSTQGHHQSLQYVYHAVKEIHKIGPESLF